MYNYCWKLYDFQKLAVHLLMRTQQKLQCGGAQARWWYWHAISVSYGSLFALLYLFLRCEHGVSNPIYCRPTGADVNKQNTLRAFSNSRAYIPVVWFIWMYKDQQYFSMRWMGYISLNVALCDVLCVLPATRIFRDAYIRDITLTQSADHAHWVRCYILLHKENFKTRESGPNISMCRQLTSFATSKEYVSYGFPQISISSTWEWQDAFFLDRIFFTWCVGFDCYPEHS